MSIPDDPLVTLISNAQPEIFPGNTAYTFTNRLPHAWRNRGGLRVAMTEFMTQNTLKSVPMDLSVCLSPADARMVNHTEDRTYVLNGLHSQREASDSLTDVDAALKEIPGNHMLSENFGWTAPYSTAWDLSQRVNLLAALVRSMKNHAAFKTKTVIEKQTDGAYHWKCRAHAILMSPQLQRFLRQPTPLLDTVVLAVDTLKDVMVERKDQDSNRLMWYRYLPNDGRGIVKMWPGFAGDTKMDVSALMEELARKLPFFNFEEKADGDRTVIRLVFRETSDVIAVAFPQNFLGYTFDKTTYKFDLVIEGNDTLKDGVTRLVPNHIESGQSRKFILTDGACIQLSRPTKTKWKPIQVSNFELSTYSAFTMEMTLDVSRYTLPKGDYSLSSFVTAVSRYYRDVNPSFSMFLTKKRGADEKMRYYAVVNVKAGNALTLDPHLSALFGFDTRVISATTSDVSVHGKREVLLSNFTNTLIIYMNLIRPNIQGGSYESVLRTIPFPKNTDTIHYEFKNLEFRDVDMTSIQNIQIDIRDETGQSVLLEEGRTMLKLLFVASKQPLQ